MKRILIVEDDINLANFIVEVLEMEGYSVDTATNGKDGLDHVEQFHPNLVISDVMMPVMDGETMCCELQSDGRYGSIPVVLMSARRESALRGGCHYDAFLAKPFELQALMDVAADLMGESYA